LVTTLTASLAGSAGFGSPYLAKGRSFIMHPAPPLPAAIGIDIGGTQVKACLLDSSGEILLSETHSTDPLWEGPRLLKLVTQIHSRFTEKHKVSGIGLGVPAAVQQPAGRVIGKANLPCLDDYPLGEQVSGTLAMPCRLDNDANQALRAELHFGVARGFANVLGVTLGTAVGGALVLEGRLWSGSHGTAGEIGMTYLSALSTEAFSWAPLVSVESIASATAIEKRAGRTCAQMFQDAARGNAEANQILQEAFYVLALAITNAHLLLDLDLVVLGGGMAKAGRALKDGVVAAFQRTCPPEHGSTLQFELSSLGGFAGAMGAACMVLEAEGHLS
jgi:glucokinase